MCMHVCMHVCTCVCMCVRVCACVYVCKRVYAVHATGICMADVGFASVGKLTIRIPKSDRFYSGLRYPDYPVFIRIS